MEYRNLRAPRAVIDLNCDHHESRTISVRATDGSSAHSRVSQVCAALRRQLPGAEFFLLGPVSLHGVCPVDLPRESARHCCLPSLARAADLFTCPFPSPVAPPHARSPPKPLTAA